MGGWARPRHGRGPLRSRFALSLEPPREPTGSERGVYVREIWISMGNIDGWSGRAGGGAAAVAGGGG